MHRAFTFALLASSALLLSACATQGTDLGGALAGKTFTWAQTPAAAEKVPTLTFGEDGRISGVAGCNRVMGSYTLEGDKITFSKMATTMMMCSPDSMKVEEAYLNHLEAAKRATLVEGDLVLSDETGNEVMRLTTSTK